MVFEEEIPGSFSRYVDFFFLDVSGVLSSKKEGKGFASAIGMSVDRVDRGVLHAVLGL